MRWRAVAPSDRFSGHYVLIDGEFRVYVYRETTRYGPTGWLIGMLGGVAAGHLRRNLVRDALDPENLRAAL